MEVITVAVEGLQDALRNPIVAFGVAMALILLFARYEQRRHARRDSGR